jgi:hypothetical protein
MCPHVDSNKDTQHHDRIPYPFYLVPLILIHRRRQQQQQQQQASYSKEWI